MREKRASVVVFETTDLTQEQFDQPILWLLAAMLVFMPAAMGSFEPWQEAVALAGGCGLAVLLAIKLVRRTDVPIVLFFALAAFQLILLPANFIAAVSPKTAATNQALLSDLPNAAERLRHLRFNFYQEGAWRDLRIIVTATCVFVVVINVFRRTEQMTRLMWVVAWIGAGEGVLAVLQTLTDAQAVYWLVPLSGGSRPDGGTFPNHNCFAQFMNLSIGAMVGLLLLKIDQTFRRRDYTPAEVFEKLTSAEFRWAWALLAMLVVSVASVFLSLSRGGMLSVAAAGVVVGVLLALRGGARGMGIGGWILGVLLVGVFSLIMAGGANLVEGRIARIGNPDDRFDRFQLSRDALKAWKDYPAVGMGLGSFRYTFQPYDRSNASAVASHAEDEYVELLQETGVAGAAIVGSFLLIILANFLRARARGKRNSTGSEESGAEHHSGHEAERSGSRHSQGASPGGADTGIDYSGGERSGEERSGRSRSGSSRRRRGKHSASPASSLSLGLCFGMVAVLVHSAADFGQHCVSIACLSAISCALLVNLASLRRRERGLEVEAIGVRGMRPVRGGVLLIVVVASGWLLWQANDVRLASAAYSKADEISEHLAGSNWTGDQGDFTDMNRAGEEAERLRPNDMRYRYWRAMNGWYTISDVHDPVTGDVILSDDKRKVLRGLADDLQQGRWSCPIYGPLYSQIGQWYRDFLGDPVEGARLIRLGFALAPGDPTVCFVMGIQDSVEGKWADSVEHFRRAASLSPTMWSDAIDLYVSYFKHPESAIELAGSNVEQLRVVARRIRALGKDPAAGPTTGPATEPSDETIALQADKRADAIVRANADRPDASAKTLAEMGLLCAKEGDDKGAVAYLGRALKFEYGEVDWRLVYAKSLAKVGRKDDAIHQAEIILRIRPHMQEAQDLIDELSEPTTQAIQELSN
jgi:O-antigen ligase